MFLPYVSVIAKGSVSIHEGKPSGKLLFVYYYEKQNAFVSVTAEGPTLYHSKGDRVMTKRAMFLSEHNCNVSVTTKWSNPCFSKRVKPLTQKNTHVYIILYID